MSIKTSKRIALGVIASLVFAPFAAIAPASASGTLSVTAYRMSEATLVNNVDLIPSTVFAEDKGVWFTVTRSGMDNNVALRARFTASADADTTSLPATIANTPDTDASASGGTVTGFVDVLNTTPDSHTVATKTYTATTGGTIGSYDVTGDNAATTSTGLVSGIVPASGSANDFMVVGADIDTAGAYEIEFWADANGNGLLDSGEASVKYAWTAAGTASKVTITPSQTIVSGSDADGTQTWTAKVTDALGRTVPSAARTVDVTDTATDLVSGNTTATLNTPDEKVVDDGIVSASVTLSTNPTDGAYTLSVSGLTGTATVTAVTVVANDNTGTVGDSDVANRLQITKIEIGEQVGLDVASGAPITTATTDEALTADLDIASIGWTVSTLTGNAGNYVRYKITESNVDGLAVSTMKYAKVGVDGTAFFSVAATGVDEKYYKVEVFGTDTVTAVTDATRDGDNSIYTVTFAEPAVSFTITPSSATVKPGSTVSMTATLADQWDRPLASASVVVSVTGRNPSTTVQTTNASGVITFSVTDTSTLAVADLGSDSITLTYRDADAVATTGTATITYSTTIKDPAKITVAGARVSGSGLVADIDQVGLASTTTDEVQYTAKVLDSTNAPIAGVVVAFTGSVDDLFKNGISSATTGTDGQASVTVYRTKTGTATITATAGTISGSTSAFRWANTAGAGTPKESADARNIVVSADPTSAAPEGVIRIQATVTDRHGNPVSDVTVTFAELGAGRWFTGNTGTADTNSAGVATHDLTSTKLETGSNTVTVSIATGNGQVADLAGFVTSGGTSYAVAGAPAGNRTASTTVTFAAATTPEVVVPPVAPTLQGSLNGRVLLFGACQVDEGDMIIYVKSPGKAWNEKAKTLECVAGEFDGSIRAPKNTKLYRVKQEGTGLWSSSVLIRP